MASPVTVVPDADAMDVHVASQENAVEERSDQSAIDSPLGVARRSSVSISYGFPEVIITPPEHAAAGAFSDFRAAAA